MSSANGKKFKPNRKLDQGDVHVENTDQVFITTTEDKLTICAQNFIDGTKARLSWATPLGIVVTLVIALSTAEFKGITDVITGTSVRSIFIGSLVFSVLWFISRLVDLYKNSSKGDVENFKHAVKNSSDDQF